MTTPYEDFGTSTPPYSWADAGAVKTAYSGAAQTFTAGAGTTPYETFAPSLLASNDAPWTADPHTESLFHLDGDPSDASGKGRPFTAILAAVPDYTDPAFGSACYQIPVSTGYMRQTDFILSNVDVGTLEFYFYVTGGYSGGNIATLQLAGSPHMVEIASAGGSLRVWFYNDSPIMLTLPPADQWNYIGVQWEKIGGTVYGWVQVNDAVVFQGSTGAYLTAGPWRLALGFMSGGFVGVPGRYDEIRFSSVTRYPWW